VSHSLAIVAVSLLVLAGITMALARVEVQARRQRLRDNERAAADELVAERLRLGEQRLLLNELHDAYERPPLGVRCCFCGKRIPTRQGLAQHERAKHGAS
jgi:hypothetical protein